MHYIHLLIDIEYIRIQLHTLCMYCMYVYMYLVHLYPNWSLKKWGAGKT